MQLEQNLIQTAMAGQLKGQVTEEQLVGLLDTLPGAGGPKVSFKRRQTRGFDDDDSDNDDDLM